MANIHLNTNGNAHLNIGTGSNGGSMSTSNSSMPKYVGARAVVERVEEGIRIWMKDYLGETEEVIAEAIDSITTNPDGSLTFNLPNGDTLTTDSLAGPQGDTGPAGADGSDGVGIASIEKTSTAGLVDTYTITYTDGGTDTFTVTNGADGAKGQDGADGADGYSPTATVVKSGDTATITITDINGTTTASISDGSSGTSAFEAEYGVATYADVKDAYDNDEILVCTVDDSGNTKVLQLVYFDSTDEIFIFALPVNEGVYWAQLSNVNGWEDGMFYFASTDVATQLADGLMSALDKQKLDGLSIHNVPSGGTSGQVLSKASNTDYDLEWATPSSGSVTDVTVNGTSVVTGGVAAVDITGKSDVGHTHTTTDVTDFPSLADVATSGDYSDLNDIPYGKMIPYCLCSTSGGTVQKTATNSKITSLTTGTLIAVKFENSNAVASPTLKLNDFSAKSIKRYGTTAPSTSSATSWNSGSVVLLLYDGTYWQIVGFLNSTYSEISEANITNGTGSSTGLASGRRVKKAVETFAPVKDVTLDGTSVLSSGVAVLTSPTSTSTPTADTISEFDASSHINSADMSAQDVSDFVDSLNVTAVSVVDYIVEQGTSGIWTYRKWNSGIAECWGSRYYDETTTCSSWGSLYYYAYKAQESYPTGLFNATPNLTYSLVYGGDNCWTYATTSSGSSSQTPQIGFIRPTTATTLRVTVAYHAIGKWK